MNHHRKSLLLLSAASMLFLLPSCDRVKEEIGLNRHTPDEFMVMKRAPLEIPEDMAALPTPQPGMPRPQETQAVAQAKQVVIGDSSVTHSETASSLEATLLNKAGANQVPGNIRSVVNKEATEDNNDKRPVIKKILDIGSDEPSATIVDPAKEAQRIQMNKQTGQPITAGETPTIQD